MAGYQTSTKLYTESSSLTSAPYSQPLQHPTTPTSPAPSLSNSSNHKNSATTNSNKSNFSNTNSPKNLASSNSAPTTPTNSNNNNSAVTRSLTNNSSPKNPSSSNSTPTLPHSSAFTPYQNSPQHPTPVTTPTSIQKNPLTQPETTMMASHLDTSASPTLGYPPHPHFSNQTHPFWPQPWNAVGGATSAGGVVAALSGTTGGSAFMPTVGYGATSGAIAQHNPRPKLTTTIWEDEGTLCYQVDARGICVARRQDNDMINGTKLLNVVGMSRGKRDGILKNEKGRVVVKVGAMHLKGVWITFARAKTLATQFKITDILYPLFVDDPSVFLHSSAYGPPMTRIPSMGAQATQQWRSHPFANSFNNATYTDGTRPWYYGNNATVMTPASSQASRNHAPHTPQHIDDEYANNYMINGQSAQNQQSVVVTGGNSFQGRPPAYEGSSGQQPRTPTTPMYPNVKAEEGSPTNGAQGGYFRPPGLYNLVSAAEVVGGTTPQSSSPQMIGQKRVFEGEDNDEYNNAVNNSNQPSPPLAMHPPPPLTNIAVSTMNVAANSFPSPLNVSPNSSPSSSAFSGWNHTGKRVKYESFEANTPPSGQSSPRVGYQLPGLGQGPSTPGSATTPTYTNSSLQLVTNAQGSPHHYSSAAATNNNAPNTGTTTPTTEGLDRYFEATNLHTPSPESNGVGTPGDENRRYEQYRQREDTNGEELNGGWD